MGPKMTNRHIRGYLKSCKSASFSIESPTLNTKSAVSSIKTFTIQAAVVIIRKMYLVQNAK